MSFDILQPACWDCFEIVAKPAPEACRALGARCVPAHLKFRGQKGHTIYFQIALKMKDQRRKAAVEVDVGLKPAVLSKLLLPKRLWSSKMCWGLPSADMRSDRTGTELLGPCLIILHT